MPQKKTYFNWSSGKDSALALYYLLQDDTYSVEYLLTSVNATYDRVSMHGLRRTLLEMQIQSIGLPNGTIELPEQPTNAEYEAELRKKVSELQFNGFECAAFGDIFLEDLRRYRETQLQPFGIEAVFPLWHKNTRALLQEFIDLGFKAIVICANADLLDSSFVGQVIDSSFLQRLPEHIDPCGENGEFHTFCFQAPYFRYPIKFSVGETVLREYHYNGSVSRFWFCDLIPL
ncbi:MAG: hypothetical protein RMI34_11460 [Chloroherpetonaceae bacterium]|nr:adenine nucleotide alpha hydrolase [Chloroherpetonaceae bacterium]MCS7212440.1 adenine nucleotide alpha hydrolase [Chloroherpetonaceae bacterium]MDW8020675.1 hypothetical protein [Chloroherpetonaceae bacterium]MDW8465505.1 hypothetical protein [Chloroherpetonaceae bacterium]